MDRDRHPQPGEVRTGERQGGGGREIEPPAVLEDARALGDVGLRLGKMFDDGMRQDHVERFVRVRQAQAVALGEGDVPDPLLAGELRARVGESGREVEAHRE